MTSGGRGGAGGGEGEEVITWQKMGEAVSLLALWTCSIHRGGRREKLLQQREQREELRAERLHRK